MKNSSLALSTKVSNGVKPPATKRELIEAMALVKQKQLRDEEEAREAKAVALKAELESSLIALVVSTITKQPNVSADLGYCYNHNQDVRNIHVQVDLVLENLPKSTQKKIVEYHQVSSRKLIPHIKEIRRGIADAMVGNTAPNLRIQALVETPETRKAIEKMLTALESRNEPATIEA
jgi:hypothetical protein